MLTQSVFVAEQVLLGGGWRSLRRRASVVEDDVEEGTVDVQAAIVVDEAQLAEFIQNSDVVFWRVPSELTSRQARLLLGKQRAKEIFCSLPELESFVRIQDQRLHECLGLLTTRFPNGFDG